MTVVKLRQVLAERPFRPFTLHVADGRGVPVKHPDFISVSPAVRTVHVFHEGDNSEFIDLLLVTGIELGDGKLGRDGRRRSKGSG